MRIESQNSGRIDRSTPCSVSYKMIRGRVTALLLTNSTTWHYRDIIVVKLRTAAGNIMVVDRMPALLLADLCDLKKGRPTIGTPAYAGDAPNGVANGENDENNGIVYTNSGQVFNVDAIEVPLGHITLNAGEELEIEVLTAVQHDRVGSNKPVLTGEVTGTVEIAIVKHKARIDTIFCYEMISNLETIQAHVREIYLCGKNHVSLLRDSQFRGQVEGKDINLKLNVDGEDSECSVQLLAAYTAITGELTTAPNALIRAFQDMESLPATVAIKVSGSNKDEVELLIIRETQVPHMVAASIIEATTVEQKRVEKLEQAEPERAAAMIQTGKIASSEAMQVAKDQFVPAVPAPVK